MLKHASVTNIAIDNDFKGSVRVHCDAGELINYACQCDTCKNSDNNSCNKPISRKVVACSKYVTKLKFLYEH